MTARLPIRVHVENNGIPADKVKVWKKIVTETGRHGGYDVNIAITRVVEQRSGQQNKAVMGYWMEIIMEEEYGTPYTKAQKDKTYDDLKIEMGWTVEKVNKKTGEVRVFPRETHTLDKDKYSRWMEDFARHVAAEHGIFLPPPDRAAAKI